MTNQISQIMTTQSNIPNFEAIVEEMKAHGMKLPESKVFISVPNAKEVLRNAMRYFIGMEGRDAQWLPEYNEVASWLSRNNGRGLFLYGNCGRGKSILCRFAIPAILLKYCRKVVTVFDIQDMNRDIDEVLSNHIISLDDIGTEELSIKFGERRMAFAEIMDAAEKRGKLVIISTNLDSHGIKERYGDRILDRIMATTTRVLFTGKSLRQ